MKCAIVTGGSTNDYDAMATLIVNMTMVMPDLQADYIIFHNGLSEKQQKRLQRYYPVEFIKYSSPIPLAARLFSSSVRYFTPMIYCKYECLRLLDTYDKVMWTDYDVVFKEDVSGLFQTEQGMTFVTNGQSKVIDMFYSKYKGRTAHRVFKEYDLEASAITTPLFVTSRRLKNYMELYHWCNQKTADYFRYLEQPEQAVFSMLIQKYHIEYGELSNEIYALHPKFDNPQAKIIHAYGQPKFWNGCHDERWEEYHRIWENTDKQ